MPINEAQVDLFMFILVKLSDYLLCHQYPKKISFEVQVSELWTVVCRRLSAVTQRNLKLLARLRIIILNFYLT